jgi:SAM-dependent methyltransferase
MNAAPGIDHYSIRGGRAGRERLRLLSRVLHDSTCALLDRVRLAPGRSVLDLGCGGGDVSRELARRVGAGGRVVGIDADEEQLRIARVEAGEAALKQIEFRHGDAAAIVQPAAFDMVYARFLLSHLAQPLRVIEAARAQLKPGGVIVLEDIDFSGHAAWPDEACTRRVAALCAQCMHASGGDPNLGLRLPSLLRLAGFAAVQVHVVQVLATAGDAKRLYPETLRSVSGGGVTPWPDQRVGTQCAARRVGALRRQAGQLDRHAAHRAGLGVARGARDPEIALKLLLE